jgi:pimeloyl-ACP methyl ester carboxylesterase
MPCKRRVLTGGTIANNTGFAGRPQQFCANRAKGRWWCSVTAGRNVRTPGGIRSRPSQPQASNRNWELTAPWQDAQIHQPSLFIAGSKDAVITGLIGAKRANELERVLPHLKRKLIIEGAGHWIQQERPNEVNAALIGFLKENAGSKN